MTPLMDGYPPMTGDASAPFRGAAIQLIGAPLDEGLQTTFK